jgi:hypothetical protein
MRAVTEDTIATLREFPNQALMLDMGAVSLSIIKKAVDKSVTNVTSKDGLTLPIELWDEVFKFGAASPHSDMLAFVKARRIESTATGHIVYLEPLKLSESTNFGHCNTAEGLEVAEDSIKCCTMPRVAQNFDGVVTALSTQPGRPIPISFISISN